MPKLDFSFSIVYSGSRLISTIIFEIWLKKSLEKFLFLNSGQFVSISWL